MRTFGKSLLLYLSATLAELAGAKVAFLPADVAGGKNFVVYTTQEITIGEIAEEMSHDFI
jgi:hypothetical protein